MTGQKGPIRGAIRALVGAFFYEPRVLIRYPAPVGATTWGARPGIWVIHHSAVGAAQRAAPTNH